MTRLKEDVRPITHLKNHTAEVVREVSEEDRTVVITQNGRARAVIMGVGSYDRWLDALALLKIVSQAERDVRAGRTVTQREAFRRARAAMARARRNG